MRPSFTLAPCVIALLALAACSSDTETLPDGGLPTCTSDDDCPGEQRCEEDACVDPACIEDEDCADGEICDDGACEPAPCEEDDECPGDEICEGGVCEEPECSDAEPCDDEEICEDGRCEPVEPEDCEDDDECEDDEICLDGLCQAPIPCEDDTDCPTELVCIDELCREPCTEDADCGSPLMFNCIEATGRCQLRCFTDEMCPEGQFCDANLCEPAECEVDADCNPPDVICEGEEDGRGRCVEVTPCGPNGECPTGFGCDPTTNLCEPLDGCRTDRDCAGDAYCEDGFCQPSESCVNMSCPSGFDCVADVCVPAVCRSNLDCTTAGEICIGGVCQAAPSPEFVTSVRILSLPGYVRPGTSYTYVAIAQDQAGRVVPGLTFQWTSSSTVVATIDPDGVATGGPSEGVSQIRARVTSQLGPVVSAPVDVTNLGPVPAGVRVTVVGQDTGSPIGNATVRVRGPNGSTLGTTDARGVASFASVGAGPHDVDVVHPNFDWVSVHGATSNDLRITLPELSGPSRAAGARGTVDLSQVSTQGALSLSLSGASIGSPLFTSDPGALLGGDVFNVQVPMLGAIPIPGGTTVRVELMGFPLDLKNTYYARARPGVRALWSFGGKVGQGSGGLGLEDLQNVLAAILPFYQRFEHAVDPAVPLLALPTVVDTADVDGDGDTTETIPDWANLANRSLTPRQAQSLRYRLTVANLPFVSGGNANTLIVLSGALLPGLGFVPLGLDGQSDEMGNGIVSSFVTKMAPRYGGLEAGEHAVLVVAIRSDASGAPGPGSTRLFTATRLPTSVDFSDGWLDSPVGATFDATTRQFSLPAAPGAELFHVRIANERGAWHVFAPAAVGATTLTLADRPDASLPARAPGADISIDAVDLDASANVGTLFDAASPGALGLDRVTRGFARADL